MSPPPYDNGDAITDPLQGDNFERGDAANHLPVSSDTDDQQMAIGKPCRSKSLDSKYTTFGIDVKQKRSASMEAHRPLTPMPHKKLFRVADHDHNSSDLEKLRAQGAIPKRRVGVVARTSQPLSNQGAYLIAISHSAMSS